MQNTIERVTLQRCSFAFLEVEICLSRRLKKYKFCGTIAEYKDTKTIPYKNGSATKCWRLSPFLETFEMSNFAIYLIIKAFNVHNWKLLPNNKLQSFFILGLAEVSACQNWNQTCRRAVRYATKLNWVRLVILVDKIDDDFDHCVLFFGAAFGNHQGEGDEGIVGDALGAILVIKNAIAVEEPQE